MTRKPGTTQQTSPNASFPQPARIPARHLLLSLLTLSVLCAPTLLHATNNRGAWSANNTYAVNDVVTYNGGTYLDIVATGPVSTTTTTGGGNLFDPTAVVQNVVIVSANGTAAGIGGFQSTGFVNVSGASSFITNITPNIFDPYGVAFYNANKAYLAGSQLRGNGIFPGNTPIPVPSGASYVRFWWQNGIMGTTTSAAIINAGNVLQSTYTGFGGGGGTPVTTTTTVPGALPTNTAFWSNITTTTGTTTTTSTPTTGPYAGKKLFFLSDSIIWENPAAASQIAATVGGSLSSQGALSPGVDAVPGRSFNQFNNAQTNPISPAVLADVDVLVIALGTNQDSSAGLGTPADAPSFSGSLSAQMRYMLETIMGWKPGMRIIMVGPYQSNRYNVLAGADGLLGAQDAGKTMANAGSIATLHNINAAMNAVTQLYGIPYVDMFNESGVNYSTSALWLGDGLHPNTLGYTAFYVPYIAAQLPRFAP